MSFTNPLSLTFKVSSFRKIPNPFVSSKLDSHGDRRPTMYMAICDIKDLPENIPMETNPRDQSLSTNVAKQIEKSLMETGGHDFYLLNRGILLSADSVTFNNYSMEMTVKFSDFDVHGNVDGGHTYKIILKNRGSIEIGQQFVKLEILTGVENIFEDLAAARNISVRVQEKSIAELKKQFEIVKRAIANQDFADNISYKENEDGDIDVQEILAILNMFNIDRYKKMDENPIVSYSSKKRCEALYIEEFKKHGEGKDNPYVKMTKIMPDIFKLYDEIEAGMRDFYLAKFPKGKYGLVKGVTCAKSESDDFRTKFYKKPLSAYSPNGFIYPILGAFRAMLEEKDGYYVWKQDPFVALKSIGPDAVDSVVSSSRNFGNNPQSVGKDGTLWRSIFILVSFTLSPAFLAK